MNRRSKETAKVAGEGEGVGTEGTLTAILRDGELARLALAAQLLVLAWVAALWRWLEERLQRRLARAEAGQSLVEYAVLTAIVVFGGMIVYVQFGEAIGKLFERIVTKLGGLVS